MYQNTQPNQDFINLQWFKTYFQPHFLKWIFEPIDRLVYSQDALIGFIFMSCVIDYLAGFWYGGDTKKHVRETYVGFINKYFPPERGYDADGLYDSLRNGLIHMFTIKNYKFILTHNHPELHLKLDRNNQIILNAGDFRDDLYKATIKYFSDVENNKDLLTKLRKRFDDLGFLYLQFL
jgi:hypothetical protein